MIHRCNICGVVERPDRDIWIHRFDGEPGYGSIYDGDKVSLYFCSECLDKIVFYDNILDDVEHE